MKKTLLFLFSLALCLTACQNEDDVINDDTPKFTLKAVFENDNEADATRTTVGNDGYTRWENNDMINVMWKTSSTTKISLFNVSELQNNGKTATFTEDTEFSPNKFATDAEHFYFAGYPAGIYYPTSNFPNQVTCRLSATQKYEAGKMVASGCNPAYACETKEDFEASQTFRFKNVCGLLRLKFIGDAKITKINFISNETDKPVCGDYSFYMADLVFDPEWSNKGNTVTLDCGSGVQLNPTTPTDFYIVLPPATYSNFTIVAHDPNSEGDFKFTTHTSHNSHTITRSKIHTISTIVCNKADM